MFNKVEPNVTQEEVREVYNRKKYDTAVEIRQDINVIRKYLIKMGYLLADREKQFAILECEYRELIGQKLSESKCFSFQEKIADILGKSPEVKDKYLKVCEAKEDYTVAQKLYESVGQFAQNLDKMAYYARKEGNLESD